MQPAWVDDLEQALVERAALRCNLDVEAVVADEDNVLHAVVVRDWDLGPAGDEVDRARDAKVCEVCADEVKHTRGECRVAHLLR